jgi:hypothetical protein
MVNVGRDNDLLRAGRSGNGIPVGARFSAPAPNLVYDCYSFFFPGVKRPGRGFGHPDPSSAEVKERVVLYLSLCLHGRL